MGWQKKTPKELKLKGSLFISLLLHGLCLGLLIFGLPGDVERAKGEGESEIISVSLIGNMPQPREQNPKVPGAQKVPGTFLHNNERMRDVSTKQKGARHLWGGEGGTSAILQQIRNQIERNKYYPLMAKRSRIEGSPLVEFKIKQDGSLEYLTLKQTSGAKILDEAATHTVQQAAPFPFYPEPIALNIHYHLNQ